MTVEGEPGGIQTIEWMDGKKYVKRRDAPIPWHMDGEEIVLDAEPD